MVVLGGVEVSYERGTPVGAIQGQIMALAFIYKSLNPFKLFLVQSEAKKGEFGSENSNSHGARPVHLIITMIKWIWTSRLSIKNSLWGHR